MADNRRVWFPDPWFKADLAAAEKEASEVAETARRDLELDGLSLDNRSVERCLALGPDGTRLGDCVKLYLQSSGHWRMVFVALRAADEPVYMYLAFGRGHPQQAQGSSVYQIADRRRHGH